MKQMKNKIWIACIFLLASSCFEDQGNYIYSEINEVIISGIEELYEVEMSADTLIISPKLTTGPTSEYEYLWITIPISEAKDKFAPMEDVDTIGREKDLKLFLLDIFPGDFKVNYKVTDKNTGVVSQFNFKITIFSAFNRGWYILKENNNRVDMDFVMFDGRRVDNVLKTQNGYDLEGEAKSVSFLEKGFNVNISEGEKPEDNIKTLVVCTGKDMKYIRYNNMKYYMGYEEAFFVKPEEKNPVLYVSATSGIQVLNAGKIHTMRAPNASSHDGFLSETVLGPQGSDYQMAGFLADGVMGAMYFDEISSSFVWVRSGNSEMTTYSKLANPKANGVFYPSGNLNCDLLYMGCKKALVESTVAVLKEKTLEGKVKVALTNPLIMLTYFSPFTKVIDIPEHMKMSHGTCFSQHRVYWHLYYAVDQNKWMNFDIENETEMLMHSFPEGETITYITHAGLYIREGYNVDKILVATEKDNQYKVYFFKLESGVPVLLEDETLHGEGKVGDIFYAFPINMTGAEMPDF